MEASKKPASIEVKRWKDTCFPPNQNTREILSYLNVAEKLSWGFPILFCSKNRAYARKNRCCVKIDVLCKFECVVRLRNIFRFFKNSLCEHPLLVKVLSKLRSFWIEDFMVKVYKGRLRLNN